ncbi:MAG: hypothetical protein EXR55_02115 [Dehalococcoidia bacterium]|nr:hypothetical protein [Dehalococcoidia bacterium]
MASVAQRAIIPWQDVLGLGSEARMNRPGVPAGNWRWRWCPSPGDEEALQQLRDLTRRHERESWLQGQRRPQSHRQNGPGKLWKRPKVWRWTGNRRLTRQQAGVSCSCSAPALAVG